MSMQGARDQPTATRPARSARSTEFAATPVPVIVGSGLRRAERSSPPSAHGRLTRASAVCRPLSLDVPPSPRALVLTVVRLGPPPSSERATSPVDGSSCAMRLRLGARSTVPVRGGRGMRGTGRQRCVRLAPGSARPLWRALAMVLVVRRHLAAWRAGVATGGGSERRTGESADLGQEAQERERGSSAVRGVSRQPWDRSRPTVHGKWKEPAQRRGAEQGRSVAAFSSSGPLAPPAAQGRAARSLSLMQQRYTLVSISCAGNPASGP